MKTTLLVVYNFDLCNPGLTLTNLSSRSTFSSATYKMLIRRINKVILTSLELFTCQLICEKVQMFAEDHHCKICSFARFTKRFVSTTDSPPLEETEYNL
jgi:hypothetical protein